MRYLGSLLVIARGLPTIATGIQLLRKEDKTEEEIEAANSFKKMLKITFIAIGIAVVLMGITTVNLAFKIDTGGYKKNGTVQGDSVRYLMSLDEKFVPLSELNISASEVNEGDRIFLFLDKQTDEILNALPRDVHEKNQNMLGYLVLGSAVFSIVMLICVSIMLERKIAKPFRAYCKRIEEEEMVAE